MAENLKLGQYDMNGFIFGTRTPFAVPNNFLVEDFQISEGEISTVDESMPYEDGTVFGVDTRTGQTLKFKINLWKKGKEALTDLGAMKAAWRADSVRKRSNAVVTLRMNKGGTTSLVYGRPRRFAPEYGAVERGWAPIDCDFKCVDENFYSDEQKSLTLSMGIKPSSGLQAGFTLPATITQFAPASGQFIILGDVRTNPVFIFKGPVTNPVVKINDEYTIKLNITLDFSQSFTIDPRIWRRFAFITTAGNNYFRPNALSVDSPTMQEMSLSPGLHSMSYTGVDPTLTSSVTIGWRDASTSPL